MQILTKVAGQFVVQNLDTKTINGFAKAITRPKLVTTKLVTVTTASEYAAFLQSFKTIVRPFAVAVITQNPEGK
jgi:hypothetical protein